MSRHKYLLPRVKVTCAEYGISFLKSYSYSRVVKNSLTDSVVSIRINLSMLSDFYDLGKLRIFVLLHDGGIIGCQCIGPTS